MSWALSISKRLAQTGTLLICVLATFTHINASTNRPLITVHSETISRNDKLTLGDIAQITNADAATVSLIQNINLGYSPEVGSIRQITRDKIALALAAAGFPNGAIEIRSNSVAIVRRESQSINLASVREAVERATLTELSARGAKAQLVKLNLPNRIEVPSGGAVEIRASAGNLRNWFAPFSVSIEIWIDGRIARRLNTTALIEATAAVVVAETDLADKTRIRTQDFRLETIRLDKALSNYIFDPALLRGMTLAKPVAKGQAITTDSVVPGIVVKTGDVVRIVTDSARLSISLTGEARAAGHIGDRIQVKNLQSGTLLQATVVDEGIVSVRF